MRIFFSLLLLSCAGQAIADDYLDPASFRAIRAIIQHNIHQEYGAALDSCSSLKTRLPGHPVGYFFHAATLQARMLDYERYDDLEIFYEMSDKTRELGKRDSKRYPDSSWPHFFLGGALGYEAFIRGKQENYLHAFRQGWQSIQSLKRAQKIDPENHDLQLGIGTYKYYSSSMSKYLRWLPFVKDERQQGKEMIRSAIREGRFSRPAALNGLFWILVKEDSVNEAGQIIETALQEYPRSRFFLWGKARLEHKLKRWQPAAEAFQQILDSYAEEQVDSPYNFLSCYIALAEIASARGDTAAMADYATQALAIKLPDSHRQRGKPLFKKAKDLLQKAEKISHSS